MRAADEPRKSKLNSYFTVKAGRRSHNEASGFSVRWRDRKGEGATAGFSRALSPRQLRADRSLQRHASSYRSLFSKSSHARSAHYRARKKAAGSSVGRLLSRAAL